ncbi:MAG: hypothetical protein ACXVEE_36110 [Polyangiales bacterium]
MRRIALISLCALSMGCSLDTVGSADDFVDETGTDALSETTGDDSTIDSETVDTGSGEETSIDSSTGDSGEIDSGAVDSGAIDSGMLDTGPFDTGSDTGPFDTGSDTGPFDTGPFDTGSPDTGPFDTGVIDTGPEVMVTGSLTGKGEAGPASGSTTNLTTEGTLGWAHWGLFLPGDFNHRSAADLIGKGSAFGGTATRWPTYPIKFSWTDGTPTASATTSAGLYMSGKDDGFTFDAAGDPAAPRTLKVYIAWDGANGTFDASLSDGSATAWSGTIPPPGGSGSGIQPAVYTLTFKPASAGAKLNIKLTKTNGGTNYLSLIAATLK